MGIIKNINETTNISSEDKDKLNIIKTDGDGSKYLNDKGEYDTIENNQLENINKLNIPKNELFFQQGEYIGEYLLDESGNDNHIPIPSNGIDVIRRNVIYCKALNHTEGINVNFSDISVCFWYKMVSDSNTTHRVLSIGTWNNTGSLVFFINNSNQMVFGVSLDSDTQISTGVADTSIDEWTYICGVREGTTFKIYRNGELKATNTSITNTAISGLLSIMDNATDCFRGDLSNILIYNRAITDDEVTQIYQNTHPDVNSKDVLFVNSNAQDMKRALVGLTNDFTPTANTWTKVEPNIVKYDNGNLWDNTNKRFVIPSDVKQVRLGFVYGCNKNTLMEIRKNGTWNYNGFTKTQFDQSNTYNMLSAISPIVEVQEGDYFELWCYIDNSHIFGDNTFSFYIEVISDIPTRSTALLDMPKQLNGNKGKVLTVNNDESGYELKSVNIPTVQIPECVFSANFSASNGWDLPNRVGSGFTYFNEEVTVNSDGSITLDGDSMCAICKYVRFPIYKATYHFKFKTNKNSEAQRFFVCGSGNDSDTPQSNNIDCCVNTDGKIYFFTETGAGSNNTLLYNTGYVLNDGNLYDLIITLNDNKINIWVNGEHTNINESFTPPEGAIWDNIRFFSNATGTSNYFQGTVYEFDIFNGILNETQIKELYENGYSKISNGVLNIDTFKGALITADSNDSNVNVSANTGYNILQILSKVEYDTDNFFDDINKRIIIPKGIKRIRLHAQVYVSGLGGSGRRIFEFYKNGNITFVGDGRSELSINSGDLQFTITTSIIEVEEGDYFTATIYFEEDVTLPISSEWKANTTFIAVEVIQDIPTKSIHLSDMPNSLINQAGKFPVVKSDESGYGLTDISNDIKYDEITFDTTVNYGEGEAKDIVFNTGNWLNPTDASQIVIPKGIDYLNVSFWAQYDNDSDNIEVIGDVYLNGIKVYEAKTVLAVYARLYFDCVIPAKEGDILTIKNTIWSSDGTTHIVDGKIHLTSIGQTNIGLSELPPFNEEEVLTSERWIDGKPIYKKVIDFGTLPNTDNKSLAHNISNVDNIWIDAGNSYIFQSSNPTAKQTLQYSPDTEKDAVRYYAVDVTNVNVRSVLDMTGWNGIFTIKYTKTTDTSNSPVALVGGVPKMIQGDTTWTVKTDGTGDFTLLSQALEEAKRYDIAHDKFLTIQLDSGTFNEPDTIDFKHHHGRNIKIIGNGSANTTIKFPVDTYGIRIKDSQNLGYINALTIEGDTSSTGYCHGVGIWNNSYAYIDSDVVIKNFRQCQLIVEGNSKCILRGTLENSANDHNLYASMSLVDASYSTSNNAHAYGYYANNGANIMIRGYTASGNGSGDYGSGYGGQITGV